MANFPASCAAAQPIEFSVFTSDGEALSKTYRATGDSVSVEAAAQMYRGKVRILAVESVSELRDRLEALTGAQAAGWGVCDKSEAVIATALDIERGVAPSGSLSRSKAHFKWSRGGGVLMLDHDGGAQGQALERGELLARLFTAVPELEKAPMLIGRSASASVLVNGNPAKDPNKTRIYVLVKQADLIPAFGAVLVDRLWLQGDGWHAVSRSGAKLARCLVDASVWSPERLDFAGPVRVFGEGLKVVSRDWSLSNEHAEPLDIAPLLQGTEKLAAEAEAKRKDVPKHIVEECKRARDAYVKRRGETVAARSKCDRATAERAVRAALEDGILTGGFDLRRDTGEVLTVADVLSRRDELEGSYWYDPIETDDGDPRQVAWLSWRDGSAKLHSHAHGGRWYHLRAAVIQVLCGAGRGPDVVDGMLAALQAGGDFFEDSVGRLVRVDAAQGAVMPYGDRHRLSDLLARRVVWLSRRRGGGDPLPCDVPMPSVEAVLAKSWERGLQPLRGVITAPTMRPDGSVLSSLGYDAATRLFLAGVSEFPPIPETPTDDDLEKALVTLLWPFRWYVWANPCADVGVLLAALLTAVVRPGLGCAPGFGFDAPMAGSGKTLLMQCVAVLATGRVPVIYAPPTGVAEQEKRIFSTLLTNPAEPVCWDNLVAPLTGSAVEAFLTSPVFGSRILGQSVNGTVENRSLFLITGRNLQLSSDTNRRVFLMRIDPKVSTPYTRLFDFNPLDVTLVRRPEMVVAGLTVIRWARKRERVGSVLGSY